MEITIFTPTYNREKYLPRLYKSLLNQTNRNFEWLVVDDGSTDNTEELIKSFIKENKINIRYYKQKNSGKHVAHNKAVELCNTELFFCVDSDDYITEKCIEILMETWNTCLKTKKYSGIVALRGYSENCIMGNEMPNKIESSKLSDLYNLYGKKGETALIFKTEYLKENKFPVFKGERFLSEEIVYDKIDKIAPLKILNRIIYIMQYLDDGMTKNYFKLWKSSPKGVICLLNSRYNSITKANKIKYLYRKLRTIMVFNAFCISSKESIIENTPNKMLSVVFFLPSLILYYIKYR